MILRDACGVAFQHPQNGPSQRQHQTDTIQTASDTIQPTVPPRRRLSVHTTDIQAMGIPFHGLCGVCQRAGVGEPKAAATGARTLTRQSNRRSRAGGGVTSNCPQAAVAPLKARATTPYSCVQSRRCSSASCACQHARAMVGSGLTRSHGTHRRPSSAVSAGVNGFGMHGASQRTTWSPHPPTPCFHTRSVHSPAPSVNRRNCAVNQSRSEPWWEAAAGV